MPKSLGNLVGRQFGEWTVIEAGVKKDHGKYWVCRCSCGFVKSVLQGNLIRGLSKSCKNPNKHKIKGRLRDTSFLEQYRSEYIQGKITQKEISAKERIKCELIRKHIRNHNWGVPVSMATNIKHTNIHNVSECIKLFQSQFEDGILSITTIMKITKFSKHCIRNAMAFLNWKKPQKKYISKQITPEKLQFLQTQKYLDALESNLIKKIFNEQTQNANLSDGRHCLKIDGYRIKFDIENKKVKPIRYRERDDSGVLKYDFGEYGYQYLFNSYSEKTASQIDNLLVDKCGGKFFKTVINGCYD